MSGKIFTLTIIEDAESFEVKAENHFGSSPSEMFKLIGIIEEFKGRLLEAIHGNSIDKTTEHFKNN